MVRPETVYLTAVSRTGIESEAAQYDFQRLGSTHSNNNSTSIILRKDWSDTKPTGYEANAIRKNVSHLDTIRFQDLTLIVEQMMRSTSVPARLLKFDPEEDDDSGYSESLSLKAYKNGVSELIHLNPGQSTNWYGFHISLLKLDFQESLAHLEIATVGSLPVNRAAMLEAGNGTMRLRVKHNLLKIAISQQFADLESDENRISAVEYLNRQYKKSVETDNRWDLPYHYYVSSEGAIYEGRNAGYSSEAIGDFDPRGSLMINLLASDTQEKITSAQLKSVKKLINYLTEKYGIDSEELYLLDDLDSGVKVDPSSDLKNSGQLLIEMILQ